jgi:hypothetical protein
MRKFSELRDEYVCLIVESDQSEGLKRDLPVGLGPTNTSNHQHNSVQAELRRPSASSPQMDEVFAGPLAGTETWCEQWK